MADLAEAVSIRRQLACAVLGRIGYSQALKLTIILTIVEPSVPQWK